MFIYLNLQCCLVFLPCLQGFFFTKNALVGMIKKTAIGYKPEKEVTMKLIPVTDRAFRPYGRLLDLELSALLETLGKIPIPEEVQYVPSDPRLESLAVFQTFQNRIYGGLPIEIGYCCGHNTRMNALEYHRSSEINIAATDVILLLGRQQDITEEYTYDTAQLEAFLLPAGTAVELYATTLHYAPCQTSEKGFLTAVVLPRGTNLPLVTERAAGEDLLLAARNKWLIGHPEGGLDQDAYIGLLGENKCL